MVQHYFCRWSGPRDVGCLAAEPAAPEASFEAEGPTGFGPQSPCLWDALEGRRGLCLGTSLENGETPAVNEKNESTGQWEEAESETGDRPTE